MAFDWNSRNAPASLAAGLLAAMASFALAAQQSAPDPRVEIARKIPGASAEDLSPSPIPGVYELVRGADIAYVSADGKYAIAGDLYDISSSANITENKRRGVRMKLLSSVPQSQMIVFAPAAPKYMVTVFTDIDCGYCRKLHGQIAEYNRLGIGVRYLFYPRSGPGTESWAKAEQVWCSRNRNETFTRLKKGEDVSGPSQCKGSPVANDYALGRKLAIEGTPAIVLPDGDLLSGYLPPAMLAKRLRGG
jgi:thiol:disulfide interchange protein DsbC